MAAVLPTRPPFDRIRGFPPDAPWQQEESFILSGRRIFAKKRERRIVGRPFESVFKEKIPGCRGLEHPTIRSAGHFLQEDKGPELAKVVTEFIQST